MLYGVRFDGVRMASGRVASVRLSECELTRYELDGADVDDVRLTLCQAGRLVTTNCALRDVALLGGNYGILELQAGTMSNVSVAEAKLGALHLVGVDQAVRFRVNSSRLESLGLEACSITDLYLWDSHITRLAITKGNYRGWITKCTLGAGRVEDATFAASFWDESEVNDVTFSGVTFERFLCARDARFVRMRLSSPRYTPGFELVADGASFEQSDRFEDSAPRGEQP